MEKNWLLVEAAPAQWQSQFPEIPALLRQLLWSRGLRTKEEITKFLNPSYERDLYDPFLFRDMSKAVGRIFTAIEKQEKIYVYGDYDADGVPGAVILKTTLDTLGAITDIYIPHREKEGYGLNSGAIQYMASQGAKVIVTCDCGISNAAEVREANISGLEVIITDHHRIPPDIPEALAILHPLLKDSGYPYPYLTGGGVAFKFAQALLRKIPPLSLRGGLPRATPQVVVRSEDGLFTLRGGDEYDGFEKWLLDLVAISTVADVGKLIGENRTFVKYGLIVLNKTRRLGLQKLIDAAGLKPGSLDTWSISWKIAPRINSAGRMDHANTAFKLLTAGSADEANNLASDLNRTNAERQKVTDHALQEARAQIGSSDNKYLLTAYNAEWHPGVIGLVAGRLMEQFRKPVIIGCRNGEGVIVGSARSINEFNVIEALAESKQFLLKFGGHPKAAGFSVAGESEWAQLVARLEELARALLHEADLRPTLTIDADLTLADANWDTIAALKNLEPCGEGNPKPVFLLHNLEVVSVERLGKDGKHLRLVVIDKSRLPRKMIGFCFGSWCEKLTVRDTIDAVVEIGVNEWNGNQEIELKIVDLRLHT